MLNSLEICTVKFDHLYIFLFTFEIKKNIEKWNEHDSSLTRKWCEYLESQNKKFEKIKIWT